MYSEDVLGPLPAPADAEDKGAVDARSRIAAALVLAIVLWTLMSIPVRILSQGHVPADDALRHVAKAISGRSWTEVLLIRDDMRLDPHPGWHTFLGAVHRAGIHKPGQLIAVSVWVLAFLVMAAPVRAFRHPEAWAATLLFAVLAEPALLTRMFLGRPFLVSMAALIAICACWRQLASSERRPDGVLVSLAAMLTLANWMHGSSYLWAIPLAAFAAARQWTGFARLLVCCTIGIAAGSALTGHPIAFIEQTFVHSWRALGSEGPSWLLVGEFQPSGGSIVFLLVAGVLLQALANDTFVGSASRNPLVWLAVAGWVTGLSTLRMWTDWGLPAAIVLVAQVIDTWLEARPLPKPTMRVVVAGAVCAALLLACASDNGRRWSNERWRLYASVFSKDNRAWLPGQGGTLYSANMSLFYLGIYLDPRLDYRFLLGFEPALLPPEQLQVVREVQRTGWSDESMRPWVSQLRDVDRIVVTRPGPAPKYPELDWFAPMPGVWVGRRHSS